MSKWILTRISEMAEILSGGTPKTEIAEYWNGNIPWLSVKDFSGDAKHVYTTEKNITELGLNNSATKLLFPGDIIISARGTVGEIAQVGNTMAFNQSCYGLRAKQGYSSDFLYYALKYQIKYLKTVANGAVFDTIILKTFDKMKTNVPKLTVQQKISDILSTYDDLIKNNNKRIKLLEQMAENLYKEWFVRFRFPGYENAEFENGIPKDWKIKSISDIAEINAGGDAPKEFSLEKTKEYPIPIYSNGIKDDGLYGYSNKATIKDNSITISARGTVGFVCLRDEPYLPIVRLISVHSLEIPLSINWLFLLLKNDIIEGYGTSQQQITVPYFKRKKILVPTEELICNFYEITKPIFSEKKKLKIINTNLIKQRDLLLPRLISGKLEVE